MLGVQVVKLREVFPHGTGFVLVFEYMLSDLSEVVRNADHPLVEAQIKSYMLMILKGIAFCHENNIVHRVGSNLKLTLNTHYTQITTHSYTLHKSTQTTHM